MTKRLTAFLLSLFLLFIPVSARASSFFDYTDDVLEDGTLIYYFQELSLKLPASWRGKVMAQQGEGGVSFYQKASHDKYLAEGIESGGFLFLLGACVNQSFTQLPSFKYVGFSESSAMNYYLQLPTDYPAYNEKEIRAEYDQMFGQIDFVVENASFYNTEAGSAAGGGAAPGSSKSPSPGPAGSDSAGAGPGSSAPPSPTPGASSAGNDSEDGNTAAGASGRDDVSSREGTASDAEDQTSQWTPQQVRYAFEHSMLPRYYYDRPDSLLSGIYKSGVYPLWEAVCTENGVDPTYQEDDYAIRWYSVNSDTEIVQVELPAPDAATLCYRIYFVRGADDDHVVYYTVESDEFAPDTQFLCTWTREREHKILENGKVLDPKSSSYESDLKKEAEKIAELAGVSGALTPDPAAFSSSKNLQVIECPQQGFSTRADKSYEWDYQVGTGISIYTEERDRIPYVIIYQGEDLIAEALEYIDEQYTPYMQQKYGSDLVSCESKADYEIGGKKLPAGLYSYRLQGHLVNMIRIYDSTGKQTVAYTAKYLDGEGDATLKALDTAVKYFQADSQ